MTSLRQWFNSTRPRILIWYFLLTAFSSVASILITHHILYARVREQSRQYVSQQVEEFRQLVRQPSTSPVAAPEQQTKAIFNAFLSRYQPVDRDDYAIALFPNRIYRYSDRFPAELLTQNASLFEDWGKLTQPKQAAVNTAIGKVYYFAEPIVVNGQSQGVLVIIHCVNNLYQVVDGALLLIIPATLGVITLAAAIAWATAGRVLAPLRVLTQTAQSITESDMTQRIAVSGTDEIATLTATFNDMLDRLQTAFASQQEFLKDAGHELRTPITVIRGYLETLKYRPERQEQTISLAIDELDRMNRLVNDLLLLAKAERPDFLTLRLEELDWFTEELYLKVCTMAERQWQLESKGLSPVRIDRQRMTQAVLNLVQNAIRHTQESDAIILGSSVQDNHAYLWVRDTGEGIALEDQQRIFERFTRATNLHQDEHHGLGLAIVAAIAEAHGGWVDLSSRPGQGATFMMVIPLEMIPDRTSHESDSDRRRQPTHHRLFGIRTPGPRLHDHRR
jgi:signal transduction histidine kinase